MFDPAERDATLELRGAAWTLVMLALVGSGCSRTYYRNFADDQTYAIERSRNTDPRWSIPARPVEAMPGSRMADPHDPDAEPIPPDDPAARPFQITYGRHFEFHGWKKRGGQPIEHLDWLATLPRVDDGAILLNRETVLDLSLRHSREYQFQVESLYLTALDLTLAEFQFQLQPFFDFGLVYQNSGDGETDSNQILPTTNARLERQFYSGAQLLIQFANNLLFEFNGDGFTTTATNLTVSFTQPLLRGAWARNVTQLLSLQERGVLYALRDFAHFRREFYVNVMGGGGGYLGLLVQLQGIRNQEENVRNLRRNLDEYDAMVVAGEKSLVERDTIAQQYQGAEFTLAQSVANFETALDSYKISLGLPPEFTVKLDDSPLQTFELTDPRLDTLRADGLRMNIELSQALAATPVEEQRHILDELAERFPTLIDIRKSVEQRLSRWQEKIVILDDNGLPLALPDLPEDTPEQRERLLAERIARNLEDTGVLLEDNLKQVEKVRAMIGREPLEVSWRALADLVNKEFRGRVADYYVAEAQIRVHLIDLTEVTLDEAHGIALGLENRLDLMNAQARVTDAWRNEEVAANQLWADLTVNYTGVNATDPEIDDVFRFDASAGVHRFGITYDAPIVRRIERNAYRASQIEFQRARRAWMLNRDQVVQQLRLNLRNIHLQQRQFEIAREQLITASRQVEEAEYNVREARESNAGLTVLLLNALQAQLNAKNALISVWVGYETDRMSLYRDLDLLFLDARGNWINERDNLGPPGTTGTDRGRGELAPETTDPSAAESLEAP
jgi:outer membrane protein TolC